MFKAFLENVEKAGGSKVSVTPTKAKGIKKEPVSGSKVSGVRSGVKESATQKKK
jgi:hypothetical protein